jgi:hypothetical protein
MTPVPPRLKKVYFLGFCQTNIIFWSFFGQHLYRVLYIFKSHKTIQALLLNFGGISDIGRLRKGWAKREKSKGKKEQFSWTLPEWFFKKLYFSYRGNISKIMRNIRLLQKKVKSCTGKLFLFIFLKNWKKWNFLNFELKLLIEDTGYRL